MERPWVTLPPIWMARSRDYGHALCDHRKAHGADDYRKLINGIHRDPEVMAHSKAGECAFALHAGLDPSAAIEWKIGFGGGHWDVEVNGLRVDVKTLKGFYSESVLMWGVGFWPKEFEEHDFHIMSLMAGRLGEPLFVWIGWTTKTRFRDQHKIARSHPLIPVDGTPYMEDHELERPVLWPPCPM